MQKRNCERCSKEFMPKRKHNVGRFCSTFCSIKSARKVMSEKQKAFRLSESAEDRKKRLIERYERHVIKNGDKYCWDWSGTKSSGYGRMRFDGEMITAHRASYEIHNGKIPHKLCVLHQCDIKDCSNPKHLFLGTLSDNMKDMMKKGRSRSPIGSKHPNSILNESQVGRIKTCLKKGMKMVSIARYFKVAQHLIGHIKYGRSWKAVKSS